MTDIVEASRHMTDAIAEEAAAAAEADVSRAVGARAEAVWAMLSTARGRLALLTGMTSTVEVVAAAVTVAGDCLLRSATAAAAIAPARKCAVGSAAAARVGVCDERGAAAAVAVAEGCAVEVAAGRPIQSTAQGGLISIQGPIASTGLLCSQNATGDLTATPQLPLLASAKTGSAHH